MVAGVVVPASQCPHGVAATAEEAVVQAYLHARDCAEAPLSQRQLATAFGLSRPKVAELVSPLLAEANGHRVGGSPLARSFGSSG